MNQTATKKEHLQNEEERQHYLSSMSKMSQRYSSLENKIKNMTQKPWDVNQEIAQIEKGISEQYHKEESRSSFIKSKLVKAHSISLEKTRTTNSI